MTKLARPILSFCFITLLFLTACGQATPAQTPTPTVVTMPETAPAPKTPAPASTPQLPPVKITPRGFEVNGESFKFIGANAIYFGFYQEYGYSIEKAIKTAKENGIKVIRIYVWMDGATWGGRPFSEYDKVLDIAARNGMYVIVTLTDCCRGDWGVTKETYFNKVPQCNFASTEGLELYKRQVESVLNRKNTVNGRLYRQDTTIFAWDLANEPELTYFTNTEINNWEREAVAYIKKIDPDHLVTMGINAGFDFYDANGAHYSALDVPGLDFFSFHYYPNTGSKEEVCISNEYLKLIQFRTETFLSLGKPVVLEEFGRGSQRGLENILQRKVNERELACWLKGYQDEMDTTFASGASGVMFWGWGVVETKNVPLWWRDEDNDASQEEFCQLMRTYQPPR